MAGNINAEIKGITYKATLCEPLDEYSFENLEAALEKASFLLRIPKGDRFAVSRWVSAKRTRSYPYVRVYNTYCFKPRITIIPIFKDEGKHGDRDYIQWDTISMMSLLGVYVILAYYDYAEINYRNPKKPKITNQKFNIDYIKQKIKELSSYQSDPLHWNLKQLENIGEIGELAINSYSEISNELGISMHSFDDAKAKIDEISSNSDTFKYSSRRIATTAAIREAGTIQPKEKTIGDKYTITIKNYLGGEYHLTADEVHIQEDSIIQIVEAKHTSNPLKLLTSQNDIKDAVFKMILFTNLENISINNRPYKHESVVKLTSSIDFNYYDLKGDNRAFFDKLLIEAKLNRFKVVCA